MFASKDSVFAPKDSVFACDDSLFASKTNASSHDNFVAKPVAMFGAGGAGGGQLARLDMRRRPLVQAGVRATDRKGG